MISRHPIHYITQTERAENNIIFSKLKYTLSRFLIMPNVPISNSGRLMKNKYQTIICQYVQKN